MSDVSDVDAVVVDDDLDDDDLDDDELHDPNRIPAATATRVLEYLVREIVEDADAVRVEVDDRERRIVLNVHVGPGDIGRVIGKRGRIAKAIRRVTRAAAARDGVEVDIEFIE